MCSLEDIHFMYVCIYVFGCVNGTADIMLRNHSCDVQRIAKTSLSFPCISLNSRNANNNPGTKILLLFYVSCISFGWGIFEKVCGINLGFVLDQYVSKWLRLLYCGYDVVWCHRLGGPSCLCFQVLTRLFPLKVEATVVFETMLPVHRTRGRQIQKGSTLITDLNV
jgi:hypothetical protein